jgi:hypothetical protein
MVADVAVPGWLWRLSGGLLGAALLAVAGGAALLALGAADPPRAGPLLWQNDFKAGLGRWTVSAAPGGQADAAGGALALDLPASGADGSAWAVTAGPRGDYTLEVAGAAADGAGETQYGLVFGWQDAAHYSAVLVNGNGYAEAYTQAGAARQTWFEFQQWPHILYGSDPNRVRVDVRGGAVTARINDEVLATTTLADAQGQVGVLARRPSDGPGGRIVFSWVRVWGE